MKFSAGFLGASEDLSFLKIQLRNDKKNEKRRHSEISTMHQTKKKLKIYIFSQDKVLSTAVINNVIRKKNHITFYYSD